MRFKNLLLKLLKYGTLLTTLGFILTVSLQIFGRFFLSDVPPWTEEASRILFIYGIAFASGLAFRGNYFVYLEAFYVGISDKARKIIDLISPILSFLLFSICGYSTCEITVIAFFFHGRDHHSTQAGSIRNGSP